MPQKNYNWIYILECENGCYYTGYTKDLSRRYKQHMSGTSGSKYTRSFKPKRIAQCWKIFDSVSTTLKIEQFIKKQSRKFKDKIVEQPKELKHITSKRLNQDLKIIPFDPKKIHEDNKK
jgi:putative endonuclease